MNTLSLWVIGSTLLVSALSFIGVISLGLKRVFLNRILFILIGLSAGALLGDVFFHLLPHVVEEQGGFGLRLSLLLLGGILIFFILEKFLVWHHHHVVETPDDHLQGQHSHVSRLGMMNLVGDGVHNFMDGMIVAGAFLIDPTVGIGTTIAVILHEIPQEVGDFGVLIHAGFTVKRALFFNFLSGLAALAGALIVLFFGAVNELFLDTLLALTAGGFLYIAGSDLIPELHKQVKWGEGLVQLVALVVGMGVMWGVLLLE